MIVRVMIVLIFKERSFLLKLKLLRHSGMARSAAIAVVVVIVVPAVAGIAAY